MTVHEGAGPLSGLTVLELGHIVAGPTAGQILADLGAAVTKIEAVIGGDQARNAPGGGAALFSFLNRNKHSVALNLKSSEGRKIFLALAERADVIIDNFAHGSIDAMGIGFAAVSVNNPSVVWLSIKGFVPGPAEARPMLDELAQMMGGLAFMTGPKGRPMRAGASIIDMGAATYGVIGVLAALRQRDATGVGQCITAGLFETSVYWVGQWMAIAQNDDQASSPMPEISQGPRMGWGIYQLFPTLDDDQIFVGITSDAHWRRFCEAFDRPDLLADARFGTNAARVSARDVLLPLVATELAARKSADIQSRLEDARVPFAPMRRPDQLHHEPQLIESGQLLDTQLASGRSAALPRMPFHASGFDMPLYRQPPALGVDTAMVLRSLGYSREEIAALLAQGAIGGVMEPAAGR